MGENVSIRAASFFQGIRKNRQHNPPSYDGGSPDLFLEGVTHGVLSLLLWTNADWTSSERWHKQRWRQK
jgi:hypothetical protein